MESELRLVHYPTNVYYKMSISTHCQTRVEARVRWGERGSPPTDFYSEDSNPLSRIHSYSIHTNTNFHMTAITYTVAPARNSSFIEDIDFNSTNAVRVQLKNQSVYEYQVTAEAITELLNPVVSFGKWFNKYCGWFTLVDELSSALSPKNTNSN